MIVLYIRYRQTVRLLLEHLQCQRICCVDCLYWIVTVNSWCIFFLAVSLFSLNIYVLILYISYIIGNQTLVAVLLFCLLYFCTLTRFSVHLWRAVRKCQTIKKNYYKIIDVNNNWYWCFVDLRNIYSWYCNWNILFSFKWLKC